MRDPNLQTTGATGTPNDQLDARPAAEVVDVLVANHRQFLAFLQRRVGDRALAEDLLQEAFAKGVDRLETLRDEESAVAWFYRSLRNAVIDYARRTDTARRALAAFAAELEKAVQPVDEVSQAVCQCVAGLAAILKPEYSDALRRVELDGLSVKAFAEERGISQNNAAVRLFRAREALRKQVVRSCGTCAEHGCLDCTCSAAICRG